MNPLLCVDSDTTTMEVVECVFVSVCRRDPQRPTSFSSLVVRVILPNHSGLGLMSQSDLDTFLMLMTDIDWAFLFRGTATEGGLSLLSIEPAAMI